MIDTFAALTYFSNSIYASDNYSKLVILIYTWFVNDTKMDGKTNQTLRFKITRGHQYNRYLCTATAEELESYRRDKEQINPLCKTTHHYHGKTTLLSV